MHIVARETRQNHKNSLETPCATNPLSDLAAKFVLNLVRDYKITHFSGSLKSLQFVGIPPVLLNRNEQGHMLYYVVLNMFITTRFCC